MKYVTNFASVLVLFFIFTGTAEARLPQRGKRSSGKSDIQAPSYGSPMASNLPEGIKMIEIDKAMVDNSGNLSESSLPQLLAKAQAYLPPNSFLNNSCINAKKIGAAGSFNTVQLFKVTSTCIPGKTSQYIVKEARDGEREALSLQAIEKYPKMKELMAPGAPPANLPSIALPVGYLAYNDGNINHILTVMPLAQGKVLCETITEFSKNQSDTNKENLKKAYKVLGTQMSHMYKRFMDQVPGSALGKSIPHGDFHCFNIFYDANAAGHLTLIDNETMADALTNKSVPADDILKLFLGLFSTSEPAERKDVIKGVDLKLWHELALASYIEGFLSAYAAAEQKQALADLQKIFNSDLKPSWMNIDAAMLKELRSKYINPVFESAALKLKS